MENAITFATLDTYSMKESASLEDALMATLIIIQEGVLEAQPLSLPHPQ